MAADGDARVLLGVRELVGMYDAALIDLWGVLHDGVRPYPGVLEALERLGAAGVQRILLSNSPRRLDRVKVQLETIGIPEHRYDHVVTSGEATYRALAERSRAAGRRRYYYVGPPRDLVLLDGLPYERCDNVTTADFVLVTGPFDDERETADDYAALLGAMKTQSLPLVCANPDLTVMRGGRIVTCAGALAQAYEEIGGVAEYFGKPHAAAYQACFALLPGVDHQRIVGIGDSPRTDLAGAASAGINGVLVLGGLHADELRGVSSANDPRLTRALGDTPVSALLPQFVW